MGTSIFPTGLSSSLKLLFITYFPKLVEVLNVQFINKDVVQFFENIISENIKARETKGIYRPDMIQLLVEAKMKTDEISDDVDEDENKDFKNYQDKESETGKIQLTDEDICAQAFLFFFAEFDTVSLALTYIIYYLALNPEVQQKLYEEIKETSKKFEPDPPFEVLMKIKYLDMVISESLRLCPVAPFTDRVCTKPYTIQPKTADECPVHLKVDYEVFIANNGIHTDSKYFPNPDRFDPERFSDENKANIVSGSYIPFGTGPRSCIGNRFALMEFKLAIYYILLKFDIVVIDKTPIPLKLIRSQIKKDAEGGFWVGFKKRNV